MFCDIPPVDCHELREQKTEIIHYSEQHLESVKRTKERRAKLIALIKESYPEKKGVAFLFSGFNSGVGNEDKFIPESSFYYLTDTDCLKGKNTQASVLMLDVIAGAGQSTLYVPLCSRYKKYHGDYLEPGQMKAADFGLDDLVFTGDVPNIRGYGVPQFFKEGKYGNVISRLKEVMNTGGTIFSLYPDNEENEYIDQRFFLERLSRFISGLESSVVDISPLLTSMRRKKDSWEIEQLRKAIKITIDAHKMVARTINDGMSECLLRGELEKFYLSKELMRAFVPIVASGGNSCILHHIANGSVMKNGDLVVVDTGAQYNHYCGDITITFPVSGKFTKRQKEIYNVVLAAHEYIRDIAKPGFCLKNDECTENSLDRLYNDFLKERGYKKKHSIGHYLGADIHDVGDFSDPLQVGDVFTIEPGIYLEEGIGIRIEDDYVMAEDGPVSLSGYPKRAEDIEAMMRKN